MRRMKIFEEIIREQEERAEKASKHATLYIHMPQTDYQCADCMMFVPDKERCTIHDPRVRIRAKGSCGFFIKGSPAKGEKSSGGVTVTQSGYTEAGGNEGYSCKRCTYFDSENYKCAEVDENSPGDDPGKIHPDGCCNAWEAE